MSFIFHFIYFLILPACTVFIGVYVWYQFWFSYWKSKNVCYAQPKFPFGNLTGIGYTKNFGEILKEIYESHKEEKVVGVYFLGSPAMLIRDLDIIKRILIKDFDSFMNRSFVKSGKYDPLSGNLAQLDGNKWRNLRMKLTPTFTSGKMKMMFPALLKCGEDLKFFLEKRIENEETVEIKEILSRFTLDGISSCALGFDIRPFENPVSKFRDLANYVLRPNMIQNLKSLFILAWPKLAEFLRVSKQFFFAKGE